MFQSTRPRGARRVSHRYFSILLGFNPRAREGRDNLIEIRFNRLKAVSIHAPARGATGVSR